MMKKRYLFPLLLALLVLVPCVIASAASYYYVNGTSWLRLRQLPSSDAKILASYRQDYAITGYDKIDNDWAYVYLSDGHEGYVQSKYVKSSKTSYAWISADKTNLRTGPAKTFASTAAIPLGEKVKVLTTGSRWSYIYSANYGYGYIQKTYLSSKKISPNTVYASFDAYVYNPNYNTVNLRAGASKSAEVLAEIDPGTKVTVWEYGSTWSYIYVDGTGQTGYMMSEYLSRSSEVVTIGPWPAPTFEPAPTEAPFSNYDVWVTSENGKKVNLRSGAGTGFGVLAQLEPGTKVTVVLQPNKTWSRVYYNGTYGYMMSKFLTTTQPSGASGTVGTHTAWIYYVDGTKVNVRNGMGTGYGVVLQLEAGSKVTVLEDTANANWSHIQFGTRKGYVQSKYLTDSDPGTISGQDPADPAVTPGSIFPFTGYAVSDNGKPVNVRRGAGTGYALAGSVPYGAQFTVTGATGRWYNITYGSLKGYIMQQFVTSTAPGAVVTPAPTAVPTAAPTAVPTAVPDPSVVTPTPAPTSAPTAAPNVIGTATVVTSNGEPVNMRRGPGLGYSNRTRVANGETVSVLGYSGRWTHVMYNGLTGYIMSEFLK